MQDAVFVEVAVEPGRASPGGVSLRFKMAGATKSIARLTYESETGTAGWWQVVAIDDDAGLLRSAARAVLVEDSSDGTVLLIVGGAQGLELQHEQSGECVREAYLVLAQGTATG